MPPLCPPSPSAPPHCPLSPPRQKLKDYQRRLDLSNLKQSTDPLLSEFKVRAVGLGGVLTPQLPPEPPQLPLEPPTPS